MRNTIYLLLGSALGQTCNNLKKYMFQFGEGNVGAFFHVLNLDKKIIHSIDINDNLDEFDNIEYQYQSKDISDDDVLIGYLTDLSRNIVNVAANKENFVDSKIEINIIFRLYDTESVNVALHLLDVIGKEDDLSQLYNVDFIGLYSDLAELFSTEKELLELDKNAKRFKESANDAVNKICKNKSKNFHRFIVIQNYNFENYPLNLDNELLVKILGDYAMICIENYNKIYPDVNEHDRNDITAIGLSSFYFDKYYFTNYLTQASIIHSLRKEDKTEKVNIEEAVKISQDILHKNRNLVQDYLNWRSNILLKSNINEGSTDNCDIELSKGFETKTEEFREDLLSIINNPSNSLRLKRAAMAVLLGKEDKSIVEKSFSRNNLTIDDCNATAMDKFVVANNEHVTFEKERNKEVVGVLPPIDESGLTDLRLEEMRSLRESILESAREMRNTKKEIDGLNILAETDETIQQQITGDEMQIGENTYKLITDIQPETFEKTYESHDSNKFKKHIDLRSFFTPIKNQGNVGTCTVFAITSIYEYILKKAESKDYDLSEHFIYYNIPDSQDSKRAKGTSYNDVIGVFKSIGVCEEVTCPYDPATVDKKPSDKAYQEALLHTICEVKGVTINHDDIISALNDGYPVAISLRIFDSFCKDANGIVTTPSAEDINKANSAMYHAMVICGYSLDDSTYIVRNSWGDKVGDKGYLYIPFDYIENKDLNPSACVVTSINSGVETKGLTTSNSSIFNNIDSHIRLTVLQRALRKEEANYKKLNGRYETLRANYETIFKELDKGTVRDKIIDQRKIDKQARIEECKSGIITIGKEKGDIINRFTHTILLFSLYSAVVLLLFVILWFVGLHGSDSLNSWATSLLSKMYVILILIDIIAYFIAYRLAKKNEKKDLFDEEQKELKLRKENEQINKELNSMDLEYNYRGRFIEKFYEIDRAMREKYDNLVLFIDKMDTWYKQETDAHSKMCETKSNDIFIPVITNEILNGYFGNNKEKFTEDIHLYELLDLYNRNDEKTFDEVKMSIREKLKGLIDSTLADFTMLKHISGERTYPYLEATNIGLNKISRLEDMSKVFIKMKCIDKSDQYIFVNVGDQGTSSIKEKLKFSKKTVISETSFRFRIVVMQKGDYKIDDFITPKVEKSK